MIELIFSIVVIGITLMSAPMLMRQASKSGFVAIQQEGINEASSRISMIMDQHWDEANTDESILDRVLVTDTNVTALNEVLRTSDGVGIGWRIGTPLQSYRNFLDPNGNKLSAVSKDNLGLDTGEVEHDGEDDIDDFGTATLTEVEKSDTDYTEREGNVTIATKVSYMSDVPSGGSYDSSTIVFNPNFDQEIPRSTSIKRITVTLTSTSGVEELNKTIIFNAFSCNIGGYQLEERVF